MKATGGIGRYQGAALLATTLLGTGVFILPQVSLQQAGGAAIGIWLVLTLLAVPITVIFGALAGAIPNAAGPAHFVGEAFGAVAGRVMGLLFLLVVPVGGSAALLMTWSFIEPWFGAQYQLTGQLLFLGVLFALNRVGFQLSARLQLGLTLAIVAVVLLLLGAFFWQGAPLKAPVLDVPAWSGISAALALGFWSFLGVEAMTHLAQDFRDPARDMVPALLIGLMLVGLIYLGCSALLWALAAPGESLTMAQAFDRLCGGAGQWVIGILGLCSGLATVNVYTASVARLTWSFSQQGVLPAWFQPLNRHQVPERALYLIIGLMAAVILGSSPFPQQLEALIGWVNGVFAVIYLASMLAALKLLPSRYRATAIVSALLCLGLMLTLGTLLWYAVAIMLLTTPLLWWQQHRQQRSLRLD
ncbi:L-methionine/branched-chain amino acid transporter [Rheinheimera tilapiae]|uniref:L-methionine/branched-chain amino acid transporter n=1 Tax=Rheinheimera tilapiae TaxID=875043 RepID=A0ABV6BFL8_9GAMM